MNNYILPIKCEGEFLCENCPCIRFSNPEFLWRGGVIEIKYYCNASNSYIIYEYVNAKGSWFCDSEFKLIDIKNFKPIRCPAIKNPVDDIKEWINTVLPSINKDIKTAQDSQLIPMTMDTKENLKNTYEIFHYQLTEEKLKGMQQILLNMKDFIKSKEANK